eukprot:NODE_4259_length_1090_cov_306.711479_g4060_i0.p1 GENE.NODE_4259_length_1090_cov_306.711479_g4060_i0~~NODE_4259_length_1090_cov_306.711479_g4060_i0.p1  ORF type:complete len:251 (-),score=55.00 NODE_4259_length_1090_cov_306.711479_g4060_i0:338-1027(-)
MPPALKEAEPEVPPYKVHGVGNDIYGAARLKLATTARPILEKIIPGIYYLDGGSLLGAFRNGKFIKNDDDFDMAIYVPNYKSDEGYLEDLARKIRAQLPAPYDVRVVNTYTQKLELYDTTSDCYLLPAEYYHGADFHTVTLDLQVMSDCGEGLVYYVRNDELTQGVTIPKCCVLPTKPMSVEGEEFPAPADPETYLVAQYGYIGPDCEFDPKTKKYVKKGTLASLPSRV